MNGNSYLLKCSYRLRLYRGGQDLNNKISEVKALLLIEYWTSSKFMSELKQEIIFFHCKSETLFQAHDKIVWAFSFFHILCLIKDA